LEGERKLRRNKRHLEKKHNVNPQKERGIGEGLSGRRPLVARAGSLIEKDNIEEIGLGPTSEKRAQETKKWQPSHNMRKAQVINGWASNNWGTGGL